MGAAPRHREALPEVDYLKQASPNHRTRAKPRMVLKPIRYEGVTPIGRNDLPSKDFHHALTPFQVIVAGGRSPFLTSTSVHYWAKKATSKRVTFVTPGRWPGPGPDAPAPLLVDYQYTLLGGDVNP